ncbi:uncharacterized protein BT62DRAFT_1006823 [Guyanagaster necrorhizus]|uniref:Uncharacterized protein n=1 Tax=Guyanagaster necrorhizus TaxID=856835 RepID=A0A9P8ASA8_9AGAR|nr:uncharacterized protein BT62DRAFT_1006823 [Guyanagaster necrorhizus MCA 3950]KAG7445791.1 hypothetical protein BT62DRAFT_1006823 [Guyanagaster necrorhizus MCA 3950]
MGHTQSTIFSSVSAETALTAVAVAGAVGFAVVQISNSSQAKAQPPPPETKGKKKGKGKAKGKGKETSASLQDSSASTAVEQKEVPVASSAEGIPGDFEATKVPPDVSIASKESISLPKKKKNKGKKKKGAAAKAESQSPSSSAQVPPSSPPPPPSKLPTMTETPKYQAVPTAEVSQGPATSGETDNSSNTGATTPTRSTTSESSPRAAPAAGFSWGDYEDAHDVEDDDEGWGVVKRSRGSHNASIANFSSNVNKTASTSNQPQTKRQRQNAARKAAEKAAKAEAEKARLVALAKHHGELEKTRMSELSSRRGGNKVSGGMTATVDDNGKLVWE